MAISVKIESHAVAYPSKVLASNGGKHIHNILLETKCDNGNFVKKGDFIELDLYEEAAATTFTGNVVAQAANGNYYVEVTNPGDALFVYQVPTIAEEYSNVYQKESNFYNEAGDIVRAYELAVGDIIEISERGFSAKPTPGTSKVTGIASKKATIG